MRTLEEAASAIATGSDDELDRLREELAADQAGAEVLLRRLAKHRNVAVRDWINWAAPRVLARPAAVNVLERLAGDPDPDVRGEALRALVDLDHGWARRLVPTYLRMLGSRDAFEVTDAIWRLVQFREPSAAPAIQQLAATAQHSLVKNNARVANLVLTGKEDELLSGLAAHDHRGTPLWIKGLLYLASPRALAALRDFADHGPDEACRQRASRALTKVEQVKPVGVH